MTAKKIPDSGGVDLALNRFERLRGAHVTDDLGLPDNLNGGIVLERFRAELSCKICYNVMKNPVLSRSCMHRFCSLCVLRNEELVVQQCPVCNAAFTGKPPFSVDDNFNQLIRKLLPINNDIGRRSLYSALRSNGIDVKSSLLRDSRLPNRFALSRWSTNNIPKDKPCSSKPPVVNISNVEHLIDTNVPQAEDIIHLIFENGGVTLTYLQLDLLPFRLQPGSLRRKTAVDVSAQQAYSICGSQNATFIAEVDEAFVPEKCDNDLKALILMLPAFALWTFPSEFVANLLKDRETFPDVPIVTLRQQVNYGLAVPVILFPDSTVSKVKHIPTEIKRARCIYISPYATVDHLCQFLIKRAKIEANVKLYPTDIKFATVLDEKQRLTLRIPNSTQMKREASDKTRKDKKEVFLNITAPKDELIPMLNTIVVIRHPFDALHPSTRIKHLLPTSNVHGRPLKIIFKFPTSKKRPKHLLTE